MELELNDIEIKQKTFTLIGMGPGNPQKLTAEAIIALRKAELIAGATRIMEQAKSILPDWTEKKTLMSARNEEILHFIREHDECTNIAILFSGDLGRYSGATEMRSLLDREYLDAEIRVLPGIGSAVEFLDRLGIPQEKVLIESAHGRPLNLIPLINSHRYVLAFLGSGETVRDTAEELMEYGMNLVRITTGTRLSYPDEEIHMGSPKEFTEAVVNALSLVLFENPEADEKTQSLGIPDDKFERGNVPMTKQEIRILSLSRLNVQKDSVVWDIGAGTGSIAIEASRQAEQGVVYAVERKEEAIELRQKEPPEIPRGQCEYRGRRGAVLPEGPSGTGQGRDRRFRRKTYRDSLKRFLKRSLR